MVTKTRTAVYDFNYHLVFVTKYRQPIFTTDVLKQDMKQILSDIADDNDIIIQEIEIMDDHVHMLISFPPKLSASIVVKTLKGGGARRWFKEHPKTQTLLWGGKLWSPSFFMSTLGNMSKDIVANYIQNQITEYNAGRPRQ